MRQEGFFYMVVLCATLLWCFAILAAPLFIAWAGFLQSSSEFLYQFFGRVCHQFDERSFHLDGQKLAVCARCSSIYFGFFLGLLSVPIFWRLPAMPFPPRWILFAAVLPMFLDVGLAVFDLHESTLWTRALSGGVFGLIVSYFILPGFLAAFRRDADDCQSASAAHF
ncbi:MAG: DUF2085 domain-containing protein [Bacteroidota bacterium]